MSTILGALDIGTHTTRLVAAEYVNGQVTVTNYVSVPTSGMKKGSIRNIEEVSACIKRARDEMQKKYRVDIYDVMVNFSSGGVKSRLRVGSKSLQLGHVIDQADVAEAESNATTEEAADSQEVTIQSFRQKYEVNDQPVNNPLGMTGTQLVSNVMELVAPRSQIEALRTAIHHAGLRLVDIVFSGLAVAEAVLDAKARDEGTLVIDFGAGTVDYLAFCNGVVADGGSIGVGGSHLTNDLALAFQISQTQAEEMKLARGAAIIQPDISSERYQLRTQFSTSDRSVSVHAIQTVTTERVDETFRILRDMLSKSGVLQYLRGGIRLTGATAGLPLITEQASAIFGIPCSHGLLQRVKVVSEEILCEPYCYATAIGLLNWRVRRLALEDTSPSFFSKLGKFLRG